MLSRSIRSVATGLALAAAATLLDSPVAGQDRKDITARVVDGTTAVPLAGAALRYIERDRWYVTGEDGTVRIAGVKGDRVRLNVSMLGYQPIQVTLDPADAEELRTIPLMPRPVVLEGIEVTTDRLRERRKSIPTSVRAFDRERLLASSAYDILDFVRMHGALRPTACSRRGISTFMSGGAHLGWRGIGNCAFVRGGVERVSVSIDDRVASLEELATFRPAEVYLVEVYSGGRHIRVYTNFMELVASGRARLTPVLYF